MNGWRLFGALATALTIAFAAAFVGFGDDDEGLAALMRFTARVSFAVFLPVYLASSLRRLWPGPATRWLLRNRRYLGVSFAWAHGLHLLSIGMVALLLGDAFRPPLFVTVSGGFAYVLVAAMTITSFDGPARRLGPRRWALLHRTGIHTVWLVFAVDWTGLALQSSDYWLPALAVWTAAGVRMSAAWKRRAATAGLPPAEGGEVMR